MAWEQVPGPKNIGGQGPHSNRKPAAWRGFDQGKSMNQSAACSFMFFNKGLVSSPVSSE
tara:strand:- start:9773 stop:9949 length:177 start_codon:yes stop_codon:yes gene_type:complete